MALSEKFINEKMLEVEREKVAIDSNTTKVLSDIRDLLLAHNVLRLVELAENPNVSETNYKCAKDAFKEAKTSIEKRWAE